MKNIEFRRVLEERDIPLKLNSLYYNVSQYGNIQKFYGQNSNNKTKSFDLRGDYSNNSSVRNFMRSVDNVVYKANRLISACGSGSVAVLLIGAIGFISPSLAVIIGVLTDFGFAQLVESAREIKYEYDALVRSTMDADDDYRDLRP